MKKFAILLAVLALLGGYAFFAVAQEDEPPAWQEQYWQVYWQVAEPIHTARRTPPRIVLLDMNNDGVPELLLPGESPLIATVIDGQLRYSIDENFPLFPPTLDPKTNELRMLRFRNWHVDEYIVDWDNLTFTTQRLFGWEVYERRSGRTRHVRYFGDHAVSFAEFERLRDTFPISLLPRNDNFRTHIMRGTTYDEVRVNFFALLDELSVEGFLYADAYFATEFFAVEMPSFLWRAQVWARDNIHLLLLYVSFILFQFLRDWRRKRRRKKAPLTAIACLDQNWAIGNEGELLFNIPGDLAHFKHTTIDHVVLMGRKTYDSLPKSSSGIPALSGRKIVVITRNTNFKPRGRHVHVCHTLDEAVAKAKSLGKVFVAGGGVVYEMLLPQCKKAMITQVEVTAEQADTFFPNLDNHPDWNLVKTGEWQQYKGLKWRICEYHQRNMLN
ncbi:MAG: dihydrofolate reductase [Oscillospiraceae bacterium]|nr:dihydrofolate reductase [Oscillospiraceae bacterium]